MRIFLLLTVMFMISHLVSNGQEQNTVKGMLLDKISRAPISNASISILNARDSTLYDFTFSKKNGSFLIEHVVKGDYFVLISYPDYADYTERLKLDSTTLEFDFGFLSITPKDQLLKEVIIKGKVTAIKLKSDTTEFDARAYVIQPNDRAEDLIRQFPGIQVDKDGTITVQGKKVNKVLLDGEEFFADDPTLITKNVRADMVDKIQLYDKKSDQAAVSGIDDGVKIKTLNIKLKEDKKNGSFGKVAGAIGNDRFFDNQGYYNKFTGKEKIAVYGTLSNTGKTGLSADENKKLTDEYNESGGADLNYTSFGIPVARSGGAHYDSKWNVKKESININYRIGSLASKGSTSTTSQNNLPDRIINNSSDEAFDNKVFRQKLDMAYQIKINDLSSLKIFVTGTDKHIISESTYLAASSENGGNILNSNQRILKQNIKDKIFDGGILYIRGFKTPRRTFSVYIHESLEKKKSKDYFQSNSNFYSKSGNIDSLEYFDQFKSSLISMSNFTSNFTYTEPLSKYTSVSFNYGFILRANLSNHITYNTGIDGKYNLVDSNLTNHYKLNELSNQIGSAFNFKKDKTRLSFGTRLSSVSYDQINQYLYKKTRHFITLSPQLTYEYEFSQDKSLQIYYDGNSILPSIDQTQPLRTNDDPLNISIGNQNLSPSFKNSLSFYYNDYKKDGNQFINLIGSFSYDSNDIVQQRITDSAGVSNNSYVNLYNRHPISYSLSGSMTRTLSITDINVGFGLNTDGNFNYSYINGALTRSNSSVYQASLLINKYVRQKYDFNVRLGPTYNVNESSLDKQLNGNGSGFKANSSFSIYFPKQFKILSDINYEFVSKTQSFNENFGRTLINLALSKGFFKENDLQLTLSVNDLLNQNVGFRRYASGNIITQTNFTAIKRYFMFSITWNFNKMGKS